MRSWDRILVLEKINPEDKDIGLMDPSVFTGKNQLHLFRNENTGFWQFRYERGTVPPALRDRFTDFRTAKQTAEHYFITKNIRIVEVKD